MLGETHPCSACGGVHESHPFGFQHRSGMECPAVVVENFAVVSLVDGKVQAPNDRPELQVALPQTDLPVSFGSVPLAVPRQHTRYPAPLEVAWLRPPDLNEVV